MPFSSKRKEGSLEKMLILQLGQEMFKMSQEHFTVPESKEVPTDFHNSDRRFKLFCVIIISESK